MPGWRIGWAIATGPAGSLDDYLESVYKLLRARLSAPHPFMYAIAPALEGPQDHLALARTKLRRRRDLTVEWAARTPHISLTAPQGAFYAFPKLTFRKTISSSSPNCYSRNTCCAFTAPASDNGEGERHMRMVFLAQEEVLNRAYAAITEFMAETY